MSCICVLSLSSRQNHSPIKVTQAVPLAIAAVKGYKQIVERLLKAGANQNYHTKVIEYMYFPSISWICTLLYIVDLVHIYVMCAFVHSNDVYYLYRMVAAHCMWPVSLATLK